MRIKIRHNFAGACGTVVEPSLKVDDKCVDYNDSYDIDYNYNHSIVLTPDIQLVQI